MHTFSCAVQSVDVDGTAVSFAADPHDYGNCTLTIGDNVLTFQRNGMLVSVVKAEAAAEPAAEPDPADAATESEPESKPAGAET